MSNTFIEDYKVKKGTYSLTAFCGHQSEVPNERRCLQLFVSNDEGFLTRYTGYIQLTQSEVKTLIQDLQNFLDRNY